jgi:hypothetical protein
MRPRSTSWPLALAAGLGAALLLAQVASCSTPSSPLAARGDDTAALPDPKGDAAEAGDGPAGDGLADGGADAEAGLVIGVDGAFDVVDAGADLYVGDATPDVFIDPDGPPELRLLNGVTDRGSVRFCLVPWAAGAAGAAAPFPASGVPYGGQADPVFPDGFDPAVDALRPLVIGGDIDPAADCGALLAAPPEGVAVAALPVLPAGTFSAPRSLLLVAAGCLGGSLAPDPSFTCGSGVSGAAGNPTMFIAELSRAVPPADRISLQILHGSAAMGKLKLTMKPSGDLTPVVLSGELSPGQVAPRPPATYELETLVGLTPGTSQLSLVDGQFGQGLELSVGSSLEESGIDQNGLPTGKGFVLVVLGPRPGSVVDAAVPAPTRVLWLPSPVLP